MARWIAAWVFAMGCAAVHEGEVSLPEPDATVHDPVVVQPSAERPPAVMDVARDDAGCIVHARPRVEDLALVPADADRACAPVPASRWRRLRAAIVQRWHPRFDRKHVEVRQGCDRLADPLREIVLEWSSGHGGSLHLVALYPADGGAYEILWIDYNHYAIPPNDPDDPWQADAMGRLRIRAGRISGARVDPLVADARALAHAEVTEHEPPARPGTVNIGAIVMSSRDYHVALRVLDDDGRGIDRFFAGYEGTGAEQATGVPLDLIARAFSELLHDERVVDTLADRSSDDAAARDLFSRRLWFARTRGEDFGKWYLRERFLGLAIGLGSDQHVPMLLEIAAGQGDASVARSRVVSVNAIAAITGFDRRYGSDGQPRPVDRVTAETLAACRPRGK